MPTTDLTQPINRAEAALIIKECKRAADIVAECVRRSTGNGHDDAPEYLDDALTLLRSAEEAITAELDSARDEAA